MGPEAKLGRSLEQALNAETSSGRILSIVPVESGASILPVRRPVADDQEVM
jgi:hypothetical protein